MIALTMHCHSLLNPTVGKLSIRLVNRAMTPSDSVVEFVFDPLYEMMSLDRAHSFFAAKLEGFSGVNSNAGRQIARRMARSAYNCVRGRHCGLYMSVKLKFRRRFAVEDEQAPPAAEVILGNIVFNGGGDQSGECCNVCLDDFEREETITQLPVCLHKFHNDCIAKWLRRSRTCPICRGRVRYYGRK